MADSIELNPNKHWGEGLFLNRAGAESKGTKRRPNSLLLLEILQMADDMLWNTYANFVRVSFIPLSLRSERTSRRGLKPQARSSLAENRKFSVSALLKRKSLSKSSGLLMAAKRSGGLGTAENKGS